MEIEAKLARRQGKSLSAVLTLLVQEHKAWGEYRAVVLKHGLESLEASEALLKASEAHNASREFLTKGAYLHKKSDSVIDSIRGGEGTT